MKREGTQRHYVRCNVCMKQMKAGSCMLRFWDMKAELKLPTKCPYGLKPSWKEYIPKAVVVPRSQWLENTKLGRNAMPLPTPKKEIQESWATRN